MRKYTQLELEMIELGSKLAQESGGKKPGFLAILTDSEKELCEVDSNFDHSYLMKFEEEIRR